MTRARLAAVPRGSPEQRRLLLAALVWALVPSPGGVSAQSDTVLVVPYRLNELVVVADRYATVLRNTVAATSLLSRADLEAMPVQTLAGALRAIPGLIFVEQDGSGRLPIAIARGFFGGGETSYVLLTIDGVPVNEGRTGLAEWSQIPLGDVERVEVLRGSASVAYGDAALGAVVNVVTRAAGGTRNAGGSWDRQADVSLGSWSGRGIRASTAGPLGTGRLNASVDYDRDDGFRLHSRSDRLTSSLAFRQSAPAEPHSFLARVTFGRLFNQDPGPLQAMETGFDRRMSDPAFSADERTRTSMDAMVAGTRDWSGGRRLEGSLRVRWHDQDRTRTLLLAPSFGDTQFQEDREIGAWARTQFAAPVGRAVLRVGAEVQGALYRTRYSEPETFDLLSEGNGRQWKLAGHSELSGTITERIRLLGGLRFDAVLPREDRDGTTSPPSFRQWSPRLALNIAYRARPASAGNLYASWTRAFKAPTVDQLFDARAIPTGEPGATLNISNRELQPQRSVAVEVGAYQRVPLGAAGRFAEVSVSLYRQELEDEIDFDIRTYRYGNIQESRHTGAELAIRAVISPRLEVSNASTLGRATFRGPDNRGNQLKNIPERVTVTSIRIRVAGPVTVGLTHRATGRAWLDDGNTEALKGSSLLDTALHARLDGINATLAVNNLFDTTYDSYGFLLFDPFTSTNVRMVHPGMGRSLSLRFSIGAS